MDQWLSGVYAPLLIRRARAHVLLVGLVLIGSLIFSLTLLKPTEKDFQCASAGLDPTSGKWT